MRAREQETASKEVRDTLKVKLGSRNRLPRWDLGGKANGQTPNPERPLPYGERGVRSGTRGTSELESMRRSGMCRGVVIPFTIVTKPGIELGNAVRIEEV